MSNTKKEVLENKYSDLCKMLKFNEHTKKFILDITNEELKTHFQFESLNKGLTILKIWLTELYEQDIKDELSEDALIEFFKIKYFSNVASKNLRADEIQLMKGSNL